MTKQARLVIIGAGIVGCATAYHLTKMGWRDILILDKGDLKVNDGSTSHAPGGVVVLSHSHLMTRMAAYSRNLYMSLPALEHPRKITNPLGTVEVARSPERWADMVRLHNEGQINGLESEILTPKQTHERYPFLDPSLFQGSLFVPSGMAISGTHVCDSLRQEAEATGGAKFQGHTAVIDVEVKDGRVQAVLTNNPDMPRVECEQLLLCANIWAPAISEKLGIKLPLLAAEHQYVRTTPVPHLAQFDPEKKEDELYHPSIRDLDYAMYFRQHWNTWGVGSYGHRPRMVHPRNVKKTAIHDFTPNDFAESWAIAQEFIPELEQCDITEPMNGMFAFSADGMPIIGEASVKGFWVAVASWITHAGGVAKSVAEWLDHGDPEWDMRQASINRFQPFQTTERYIDVVCTKNYREVYDLIHPRKPPSEPRNIRLTPFYSRLEALKADYTVFAGLELPNWFEENSRLLEKYDDRIPHRSGWASQYWSRIQGAEHLTTRENVAMFDLTGLSIIEISGPGALDTINYISASEMDKPVGQVVYTTWLNPKGGLKRDLAITRMAVDRFWVFVGEGTLYLDLAWLQQHAPTDGTVAISNISDSFTGIGLWGPNARKVLEKVTPNDVSNEGFPYFTAQWIEIGMARVLAMRISYTGELGWELHIPMDSALLVWDTLWEAGREFDLATAGMGAFDSLRLEKGYRLWGGDIHTEYNAYEAGLGWTVKLTKDDFIGRDACLALKEKPLKKKLCCLTLDDANAAILGYEPIFAEGQCVGYVTSANYGYSMGQFLAYGYLPVEYAEPGTQVEIVYFDERFTATVTNEPMYDPKMERLKA
ncbi:MAG: FAD-dependent oxidoreductase [Chloroflexota bacterium]